MGLNRIGTIGTGYFRIDSATLGGVEYEVIQENGQWALTPKLGETLMAKAINFNKDTQPIDVIPERLAQLVTGREKAIKEKESVENLLNSLLKAVFQTMPTGFPFACTRCKFEGFTVDFLTLAINTCPNCETQGYIKLRPVVPTDFNKDEKLNELVASVQTVNVWFNGLEDKPSLPAQALQAADNVLRSAGLLK